MKTIWMPYHKRQLNIMRVCYPLILFFSLLSAAQAGDDTWVTVQGTAIIKEDRVNDARTMALEDAVKQAAFEAVGKFITAESLQVSLKLSGSILGAIPYCRIVKKDIIQEGDIRLPGKGEQSSTPAYRVKIKAVVAEVSEGFDPDFKLQAAINQAGFKEGSEMQIRVTPTRDCDLYIFNLLDDEKILRLIPNKFNTRNSLQAGKTFHFPDQSARKAGVHLIAHLPKDKKAVSEAFYLLALKKPFKFNAENIQEGIFGEYHGQTTFMNDLIREIAIIPYAKRAEKLLPYQIVQK